MAKKQTKLTPQLLCWSKNFPAQEAQDPLCLPVSMVHQEEQPNQSLALKREMAIKAMSRQAKESLIQMAEGQAFAELTDSEYGLRFWTTKTDW